MLSAIAGSISQPGGLTMSKAARVSVIEWPTVNMVTIVTSLRSVRRAAAGRQEQDVVGPDHDVVHARGDEGAITAKAPAVVPR
jgi:hypothetical protein